MFGSLGPTELLIILVVILVLFGGKKLPELASGLGTGIKNFKKALNEDPAADKDNKVAHLEETSKSK